MTTSDLSFGPPDANEIEPMNQLLEQALHFGLGGMAPWMAMIGYQHARVVRRAERVVAGLSVISMGHFFGGRRVPTAGITAVGVAPDQRGSGVGLWMLCQMLEEQRQRGVPIATLYPATTAFYRRAGFERAAQRIIYEVPTAAIGLHDHTLTVAPVTNKHYDLLKQVYAQRAVQATGWIDRPDFYWQRFLEPHDKRSYTFVVLRNGVPEGYIVFMHATFGEPLVVRDLVALTPEAGRRLLTVLADHRSMVEMVRFPGGPNDPLLFSMPEQQQKVHSSLDLMLRIIDVAGALSARGYPAGVATDVHFELADELIAANNRRFVLHVADGRGIVRPGGRGSLQLTIRDLAALYTGYYTPHELRMVSPIVAEEADLAAAALAFAGPRPWLPDMF